MNQCKYIDDCNCYSPDAVTCTESKDKSFCGKFRLLDSIAREHDAMLMRKIKKNDILESRFNTYIFAIGSICWAFAVYAVSYFNLPIGHLIITILTFALVFYSFIISIGDWVK